MRFVGETVVRLRRTQTDVDRTGAPIYSWVETVLPAGAGFDPGGSREPFEVGRAQVITTPKAYFVTLVDVLAGDKLRIRGADFDVIGDPAIWESPFRPASVRGTVVELQAVSEGG